MISMPIEVKSVIRNNQTLTLIPADGLNATSVFARFSRRYFHVMQMSVSD